MPRISVVIPTFNRQALTERAIASALEQAADADIVVIDDASEPPFRLPTALANVRLFRNESNLGAGPTRSRGVSEAQADWIAFLDSDDHWLPGTLLPRLEEAERNFAATGDVMTAYAAGFELVRKATGHSDVRIPRESANLNDFASGCWFCPGSTLIVHKRAFERVGPFDPTLRRLEDLDWFLRFALAGGKLSVWPHVATKVEVGVRPQPAAIVQAGEHLRAKYLARPSATSLPPSAANRLNGYLELELASAFAARRNWLATGYYFTRSWLTVPRLTLHLERFWRKSDRS